MRPLHRTRFALLCLLLLAFSLPAAAQTIAIRAGHVIHPEDGTVADNQVILVQDGKIVAVGSAVQIPKDARVVDLSSAWVMPGLMDAHTHITMNLPPAPHGLSVWESYLAKEGTALRALRGAHNAKVRLLAGFTAQRDVGNAGDYADSALREAIERGWIMGPTLINSGKIIAPFGGQVGGIAPEQGPFWQFEYLDADTPDEIRKAIRQNIYYGATVIKLVADSFPYHYTQEDIRAAADEAHRAGLKLAVHTTGGQAARDTILGGADSIEHGYYLSDELLQLMKEHGTVLVGTDFPYEHLAAFGAILDEEPRTTADRILDRLRRAHRIGVKMAFGTDVVADLPGESRADMALDFLAVWTAAGVPPADILKAMTTNCSELLGIEKERGAIREGLAADIIATPTDPLKDIQALRAVGFVMKDGKIVKQ